MGFVLQDDFEGPLAALGQLLAERSQSYALFAIGSGALQLLGLITRPTRDIDVVAFVDPSEGFGQELRGALRDLGVVDVDL